MQVETPVTAEIDIHVAEGAQKRTFEEMNSTSSQKQILKYNISEIRAELLQKLPELKDSIMHLTDEEIQKIMLEST